MIILALAIIVAVLAIIFMAAGLLFMFPITGLGFVVLIIWLICRKKRQ